LYSEDLKRKVVDAFAATWHVWTRRLLQASFPDIETVCMHVFGLPVGDLPKQARSPDEIRASCP
jgi:hypothetical protein